MEFRKLISFGKSSYIISIPKSWIQKNNLKKGDLIGLDEKDGNLILSSNSKENEPIESVNLDAEILDPVLIRYIHAVYKKGIDQMDIKFSKPEQLSTIQRVLSERMIGFEIIKQEKDKCTTKVIAGAFEGEFDAMLRRTFLLLKSMSNGITEAMENKNIEAIPNVKHLEEINNKYTGFCRRLLNKKGYHPNKNLTFIYCLVEVLENTADEYRYLCNYFLENKNVIKNINKNIIRLYEELNNYFDEFYHFHYKYSIQKLIELINKKRAIIKEAKKILENPRSKNDASLVHYLITISEKISDMLSYRISMEV